MRKRSPIGYKAEDIMQFACDEICKWPGEWCEDELEERCGKCRLAVMVHLSVKN